MRQHHLNPADGARAITELASLLAASTVMVVAMMTPLAVAGSRHVALTSFWWRRHRAQMMFLAGYLGVWAVVGAAITLMAHAAISLVGLVSALAIATLLAGCWQLTKTKRVAMRRCRRVVSLAATGRRADRDCLRFGAATAASCVVTCGGIMAIAATAGHSVIAMPLLMGLQLAERSQPRTDPRAFAWAISAIGVLLIGITRIAGSG